jgi:hypothetical protein
VTSGYEPARPGWGIPQGDWHRPLGDQSPFTPPDPEPPAPAVEDQEAAPMLRFVLYTPATTCTGCARAEDPRPALIQRLAPAPVTRTSPYTTSVAAMVGQRPATWYDRHRADWMATGDPVNIERMLRHDLPAEPRPAPRPAPPQLPLTRWRVIWAYGLATARPRLAFGLWLWISNVLLMCFGLVDHQLGMVAAALAGMTVAGITTGRK